MQRLDRVRFFVQTGERDLYRLRIGTKAGGQRLEKGQTGRRIGILESAQKGAGDDNPLRLPPYAFPWRDRRR